MHKLYRIYTENVNESLVLDEVDCLFPGYTVYHAVGCWKGTEEESLIIELILDASLENKALVNCLADSIKKLNAQESVLITTQDVETIFR
jgi:hypothetical protein